MCFSDSKWAIFCYTQGRGVYKSRWQSYSKKEIFMDESTGQESSTESSKRHGLFVHEKKNSLEKQQQFTQAVPNEFGLGIAKGKGDCFFDACAEKLNEMLGQEKYTFKSLRHMCHTYAVELDKRCNTDRNHLDNWIGKSLNGDSQKYLEYLANIQYTVEEREAGEGLGNDRLAIWGEPHLDGRIICEQLDVRIHVIEVRENPDDKTNKHQKFIVSHNLVDKNRLINVGEEAIDWNDEKIIHIAACNLHFVPILKKTTKQNLTVTLYSTVENKVSLEKRADSVISSQPTLLRSSSMSRLPRIENAPQSGKKIMSYPQNGILCLYNQFPSMYANLREMTLDIPRIAAMGFNAVWINPFHPSARTTVQRGKFQVSESYYAPVDYNEIDPLIGSHEMLEQWIQTVSSEGLIPVFDLVLKHVGIGINFTEQRLKEEWFKSPNSDSIMNDVRDFRYSFDEKESPDKSRPNETELEVLWKEVFDNFWKPYIHTWLQRGFRGVRIDAVRFLPPYILRDVCAYIRKINPQAIIFGELLYERNIEPLLKLLREQNVQITHITNSLYWANFSTEMRTTYFKNDRGNTPEMLGLLNAVTHEPPYRYGGSVGFGGSHDEDSLFTASKKNLVRAKQKIASVAFTSTGGWFLICGDEFGHTRKKNNPPFPFKIIKGKSLKISAGEWHLPETAHDLTIFIKQINSVLGCLPPTTANDWIEHLVLKTHPELIIMLKNVDSTGNTARLIIANCTDENVIIDEGTLEHIATEFERVQREKPDSKNEGFVHYLQNSKNNIINMRHSPEKILTIGIVENRCYILNPRIGNRK